MRKLRALINRLDGGRYLPLALYWPFYCLAYTLVGHSQTLSHTDVFCALDAAIPFLSGFIIPYLLWFPFWIGVMVYALTVDGRTFKRMMVYFMLTFTFCMTLFTLCPTRFPLRPETVPDGPLAWIVRFVYWVDAPTNVCPSEHVVGAFAAVFGMFSLRPRVPRWVHAAAVALAGLICLSIMFVKQHSALDLLAALPVCAAGYWLCFSNHTPIKWMKN